jgi:hypothetical protein
MALLFNSVDDIGGIAKFNSYTFINNSKTSANAFGFVD